MARTYPIIRMSINNESVVFADAAVIEADVMQEIHPISIEVPASTARVRVYLDNVAVDALGRTMRDKFSPFSNGIYYQSMVAGLIVDIYESIDGIETYIGRFYLDEWKNPTEGEFELLCVDAIGVLENKNYLGNFYEFPTPVSAILADILDPVSFAFAVDTEVGAKKLKGYLPGNKSIRQTLQQVLFAAGAYPTTVGSDVIRVKNGVIPMASAVYPGYVFETTETLPAGLVEGLFDSALFSDQAVKAPITDLDKTDSQALSILQLVTAVELTAHDYTRGQIVEEIFSAELTPGDYMVVYPKPYWQVTAIGVGDAIVYLATADGEVLVTPDSGIYPDVTIFTIYGEFEFGTNHVFLHVTNTGTATVTGKPWVDSTQLLSCVNPDGVRNYEEGFLFDAADALFDIATFGREWSVYAPPNVWNINDATMVPTIITAQERIDGLPVLAPEVLVKVVEYTRLRYQQNITLFPRVDTKPGEVKIVDSLYGKDVVGVVERMTSNLTGGYLIETELVGTERTFNG